VNAPSHHPSDDTLLAYSAGTVSEGLAVFVAAHLTFCPRCRDAVAVLDLAGQALVPPGGEGQRMAPSVEQVLARLDDEPQQAASRPPADAVLPAPLRERVGALEDLAWRSLPLGVAHARLDLQGASTFLYDFPPGLTLPAHHHESVERAMPLVGGFSDEEASYGPGDVSVKGGDHSHHVTIDAGDRCLALFVNDGEIVPDSLPLRWLSRLAGLG